MTRPLDLKAQNALCRTLLEAANDAIWVIDLAAGRGVYINPSGERLTGYTSDEILSCDWRLPLTPESGARIAAGLSERIAAFESGNESARVRTDQIEVLRKDGAVVPVEVVTTLVGDESGRACQVVGVTRDMTERKRADAEREALQLQLLHAQKMESVGRLAGGVAHDFNNLLTVISGYGAMAMSMLPDSDPARPAIEEILKAGERAGALVRQLLVFSREQALAPEALDLNAVVGEVELMANRLAGAESRVVARLDPSLPAVLANRDQIGRVIMNLVANARDATPRGGQITIETRLRDLGEACPVCLGATRPGFYVELAVHDEGTGMDEQVRQRLFEPFFTTKEAGTGAGLGLAVVHGIVSQCGGHIDVESVKGKGASFRICLPVAAAAREPQGPPAARILVIDDEKGVRRFLRAVLEGAGYGVLEADGGEQALRALRESPVELVITDLVMPGWRGVEIVHTLRREAPSAGVIVLSGTIEASHLREAGALGALAALAKPVSPGVLLAEVRTALQPRA